MTRALASTHSRAILVTGATGLVGHELIDELQSDDFVEVVGVSRNPSSADSEVVAWDMGSEPPPQSLRRHWDAIVHTAANTRWTMSAEEATAANVATVRALQTLVSGDTHVVHISTAYAVGLRGDVESTELDDYRNTYEWSKAHAERVARETFVSLTIVRPPLIVGRRGDGRAARFSGMYTLIRGLTLGTVPAIVSDPDARFDAIPVDDLCHLLADLAGGHKTSEQATLTIAAGEAAPTVGESIRALVGSLNIWREQHGHMALPCPPFISPESWNRFFRPFVQDHLRPRQLLTLNLLRSFEPYLAVVDPIQADYTVNEILPCLEASARYWAEMNPRIAALAPRPWQHVNEQP